jgi:hypothetical protein
MKSIDTLTLIVVLCVPILLFGRKWRQHAAALADALYNNRGGPGSPSHPIPANDSKILNRRRSQRKDS